MSEWGHDLQAHDLLLGCVRELDTHSATALIEQLRQEHGTDAVVADVLVPLMFTVGELWESGKLGVLHEHHASQLVRSALAMTAARRQLEPDAPIVVLACPPAELHEIPLHLFAAMLEDRGVRPLVLGASTPWMAISRTVHRARASACVISGRRMATVTAYAAGLKKLATNTNLFLAGPVADSSHVPGVSYLTMEWPQAADLVAEAAFAGPPHSSPHTL